VIIEFENNKSDSEQKVYQFFQLT